MELKDQEPRSAPPLEQIPCNLCGSEETRPRYKIDGLDIVECIQCGLIYVNPRVNDPNPDGIYDDSYFDYYRLTAAANRITYDRRLRLLERHRPAMGKILDVGCGTGDFLEIAQRRGWDPEGMDISDAYAEDIPTRLGLPMKVGDYAALDYPPDHFDVVNLGDSIEHMLDPMEAVEKTFAILKPGGIGFIRAPDIHNFAPRLTKSKWIQLKPREHLFYFTRKTMRAMLEKAGFEILEMGQSGTWCNLDILRDRLRHYYNPPLLPAILDFLADTLKLGQLAFYLDVFEELQVVFRKPGGAS